MPTPNKLYAVLSVKLIIIIIILIIIMSDSQVSVNITHRAPGIQPPLYIAGSFSNPQWVPEPMEYTTDKDGVYTFTKTVRVKPNSSYQYKYRVGETDWWILNEDAPIGM